MKRYTYLMLLMISVSLLSCSGEEPVDPESSNQVLTLSITTSSALVHTYLLIEMTAAAITPGSTAEGRGDAAWELFFGRDEVCGGRGRWEAGGYQVSGGAARGAAARSDVHG